MGVGVTHHDFMCIHKYAHTIIVDVKNVDIYIGTLIKQLLLRLLY